MNFFAHHSDPSTLFGWDMPYSDTNEMGTERRVNGTLHSMTRPAIETSTTDEWWFHGNYVGWIDKEGHYGHAHQVCIDIDAMDGFGGSPFEADLKTLWRNMVNAWPHYTIYVKEHARERRRPTPADLALTGLDT
jgi:hypothetical protein